MKNDEGLSFEDHDGVRRHAARLLAEAAAVGRFPTPIEDLLTAAKVRLIEEKIDQGYVARLYRQAVERGANFLRAIGKVIGLCHPDERLILIDKAAHTSSKPFIKLHETAHVYMPHQRQVFAMMMDCRHTLDPDVKQLFENEANAFASEVLFPSVSRRFAMRRAVRDPGIGNRREPELAHLRQAPRRTMRRRYGE